MTTRWIRASSHQTNPLPGLSRPKYNLTVKNLRKVGRTVLIFFHADGGVGKVVLHGVFVVGTVQPTDERPRSGRVVLCHVLGDELRIDLLGNGGGPYREIIVIDCAFAYHIIGMDIGLIIGGRIELQRILSQAIFFSYFWTL